MEFGYIQLICIRGCLANAWTECSRFRAFAFVGRDSLIRGVFRRRSWRLCTKWDRRVRGRTSRRPRMHTTMRWRWISGTSASRDDTHWRRRWEHQRRGKPTMRWRRRTKLSSGATRSATQTSAGSGKSHKPWCLKLRMCRWRRAWQMFERPSTIRAANTRGSRSIPRNKQQLSHRTFTSLTQNCNLHDWRCCDNRWRVSETDNMDMWSLWNNIPTIPCSWSCWRILRSFRSSTASRTTSAGRFRRCRTRERPQQENLENNYKFVSDKL